jgi:hypothetical protein
MWLLSQINDGERDPNVVAGEKYPTVVGGITNMSRTQSTSIVPDEVPKTPTSANQTNDIDVSSLSMDQTKSLHNAHLQKHNNAGQSTNAIHLFLWVIGMGVYFYYCAQPPL